MHLVIRADSAPKLGAGHVMRCLALADEWATRGGSATFALCRDSDALIAMLTERGHRVFVVDGPSGGHTDAAMVVSLAETTRARAVLVDGRSFSPEYLLRLRTAGIPIALIDDEAIRDAEVELVINHNPGAETKRGAYSQAHASLLGRKYALLRREFLAHPCGGLEIDGAAPPRRLLISFGGSDPKNATARVLAALPPGAGLAVTAVIGPVAASSVNIVEAAGRAAANGNAVALATSVKDMALTMALNDVAVAGCGGTLAELAYLGRPTCGFVVADDQARGAAWLVEQGQIADGRDIETLDDAELAAAVSTFLSDTAQQQRCRESSMASVDGEGASRVVDQLEHLSVTRRTQRMATAD